MTLSPHPSFTVITDGGMDALPSLHNQVAVVPFALRFGEISYVMKDVTTDWLYQELKTNPVQLTTTPPTPLEWKDAFEQASTSDILAVTASAGLSGSFSAAQEARGESRDKWITLHDTGSISGAQAFQVHAAQVAAQRGESIQTALQWMEQVHEETCFYFTVDTLEYLKRGGRIGRVSATLGEMMSLKPIVILDNATGTYIDGGRTRGYNNAIASIVKQITKRYGVGTPLRAAVLYGAAPEDADYAFSLLEKNHPLVWKDRTMSNPVISTHVGPRALQIVAAPNQWPWER